MYFLFQFLSTVLCFCIIDRLGHRTSLIMSSTITMICMALLALLASLDEPEHMYSFINNEHCHRIILSDSPAAITIPKYDVWLSEMSESNQELVHNPPPYPMLPTPLSLISSDFVPCFELQSSLIPTLRILAIITIFLHEAAYALGFGTLTWILLCELFPTSIRGRGICAFTCLQWIADFIIPTKFIEIGM